MHITFVWRRGAARIGEHAVIVCLCKGVTDRRIRREAAAGHSLDEVFRRTGAGSGCGSCRLAVARIVAEERAAAKGAARPAAAIAKQDAA